MNKINEFFKNKCYIMLLVILFIMPFLYSLGIIGFHSNELVIKPVHYVILFLLGLSFSLLVFSAYFMIQEKKSFKKIKKGFLIFLVIFISIEWVVSCTGLVLLYGPNDKFRNFLIPSAMTTMNHQYLATWFYSKEEIEKVMNENQVIESDEDTDLNLIDIGNISNQIYANEYEKQILKRNKDEAYKLIVIDEKKYSGYLVAIYDPARVKVGATKYLNRRGQFVMEMAADEKAIVAINGGGFIDPGHSSSGGIPHGIVIKDGKVLSSKSYEGAGGLIGFTKDNKLILGKMSSNEALEKGVRDALTFGPFLIVNGKRSFIKGNGGWGEAPRTAIGQRQDGIVLFLVIDGRRMGKSGADMIDLCDILERYGAYNAANLDGGTSSVLVFPEKVAKNYLNEEELKRNCRSNYCYINDPIDSGGSHETRWIATSFVVK